MSRVAFRVTLILGAFVSLVLRFLIPPNPLYGATHDDQLMVNLADQIRSGNWLGNYETLGHLTLAKPAGFPLFLAYTRLLPWAPTVTVHLMLLAGTLLFARELRRMGTARSVAAGFVIAVAFCPPFFGDQFSRVYREGFLTGVTFLVIGLAARLGSHLASRERLRLRSRPVVAEMVLVSLTIGFLLSWSIATKPSWYPLGILAAGLIMRSFIPVTWPQVRGLVPTLGAVTAAMTVGLVSVTGYVIAQNDKHYGIRDLDTFAHGPFTDANNVWASVRPDDRRPYVLVDASQREKVYEISATARQLRPYLEYPPALGWRGPACSSPMQICDESSAWFPWELRDAVEQAGLGKTATQFNATLATLASDISDACASGRLRCTSPGLAPGVLPLGQIPWRLAAEAAATGVRFLVSDPIGTVNRGPYTTARDEDVRVWENNVRGLPDREYLAVYRPEAVHFGNTLSLLQTIYGALWLPALFIGIIGLFARRGTIVHRRTNRVIAVTGLAAVGMSLAPLTLLEASSGSYLTMGVALYLLPAYPALFLVAVGGWSNWLTPVHSRERDG